MVQMRPSFPTIDLGVRQSGGQDAINRLGFHLSDVAAWYGRSAGKLREEEPMYTPPYDAEADRPLAPVPAE